VKVHEALAAGLARHGVDTLFGLIGDANLFLVDSFVRRQNGTYVGAVHEAGAVLMAAGHARARDRVGAATVTHGPGLTNTVTALVEGVRGGTPLVLLAGDTAVSDPDNVQNIDQRELVATTGAGFVQVRTPDSAVEDLALAFRRAALERRPVVLNMPAEFQWADTTYVAVDRRPPVATPPAPAHADLDRAVGVIASARRPIVLAGRGATSPAARAAVLRLAERIVAPVATTLKAKDLFRGEPFDLGIFGTVSTPVASDTIARSDCVVALGASLSPFTTVRGSLLEGRSVVHCDVDPARIGGSATPAAGVVGDCAVVADEICSWLDEAGVQSSGFRSADLLHALGAQSSDDPPDRSAGTTVDVRTALRRLETALPAERTLVTDGGRFMYEAWRALSVRQPGHFLPTVHFGSIGLGLATAIGARFGAPDRPVVLVTGDGGFMLGGLAEFSTAVRLGVDLVVVVLDDGGYGAEHIQFRSRDMDPSLSLFIWPDLAGVARAMGGVGVRVRRPEDLDDAVAAVASRDRPLLLDVHVDPDLVPNH
jgi:thiamine pyrophosphate-dependent acetolactate synthase large subunit-like protein